ncbi:MAG: phosphotransferase, partial [Nocardioidaceae bacterium]
LDLDTGVSIFVKAASSADDALHGWPLSDAYREEARKLSLLSPDIGSPPLLWTRALDVGDDSWIMLGFAYVDGRPPRRPWQSGQLGLVLDRFIKLAPALATAPKELELEDIADHLIGNLDHRLDRIRAGEADSSWLRTVEELCRRAPEHLRGQSVVHMDLRDDNLLIGTDGQVWFVDWNWPVLGAPWIDTVCVLLSARGDGLDVEPILAEHPLTRDVDPAAINCLLAVLLSFWAIMKTDAVPASSPHLRDHQSWYADVTQGWLAERLAPPDSSDRRRA